MLPCRQKSSPMSWSSDRKFESYSVHHQAMGGALPELWKWPQPFRDLEGAFENTWLRMGELPMERGISAVCLTEPLSAASVCQRSQVIVMRSVRHSQSLAGRRSSAAWMSLMCAG